MATFAHNIAKSITKNKFFSGSPISPSEIEASATAVEVNYPSRNSGQVNKDKYQKSLTDLDDKIHTVGEYVTDIAKGDPNVIHEAGYESTKAAGSSASVPVSPNAPKLESLSNGTVKSICNAVKGAKTYTHILVMDTNDFSITKNNGVIEIPIGTHAYIISNSTRSITFERLPSLKKVIVGVIASNAAGSSGFSNTSTSSTII